MTFNDRNKIPNSLRADKYRLSKPTIKWKLFNKCNYKCSYCEGWCSSQDGVILEQPDKVIRLAVDCIPPGWRVYLTGGEVTIEREILLKLVHQVGKKRHDIRIISNASASVEYYSTIYSESLGMLNHLLLTRHPEYQTIEGMVEKVSHLRAAIPSNCRITVRQVVNPTPDSLKQFLELHDRLVHIGVQTYPLRLTWREEDSVIYARYDSPDCSHLASLVFKGYHFTANRRKTHCIAGSEFAYLDVYGNYFRCGTYRSNGVGLIGNIWDGELNLSVKAGICRMDNCACAL